MIVKVGAFLLIALAVTWTLVASPEIFRNPGNPIVGALVILLGSLWISAVPGAYFLAVRHWLKNNVIPSQKDFDLVVTAALVGGFIVSYAVMTFCVGLGALTVFNLGGMYESSGLWGLAPLIAGKFSLFGLLAGVIVGMVVSRRARV